MGREDTNLPHSVSKLQALHLVWKGGHVVANTKRNLRRILEERWDAELPKCGMGLPEEAIFEQRLYGCKKVLTSVCGSVFRAEKTVNAKAGGQEEACWASRASH